MMEEEVTLSGQIAALIEAVGGWQSEAMQALQDALASAGGIDQAQLIALINQYLTAPDTLAMITAAVVQSDHTAQQIQQLISQYSAAEVTDAVRNVLQYLPDTSSATGVTLASRYSIGQTLSFSPSGVTTPSGSPVVWQLTDLVGVTASATEFANGASVTLTFTGPGSMTVTAVSNGIAAQPVSSQWDASTAVMVTPAVLTPIAGSALAQQPVVTSSVYSVSPAGYDTHTHSQCQIRSTSGSVLWDSGEVTATREFAVNRDLPASSTVDIVVRYKGSRLGWGAWSPPARRQTQAAGGPGFVYPDGGIGGPVVNGYRLIVAPKSKRGRDIKWGLHGTDTSLLNTRGLTPDSQSGWDNTNTLISNYSGIDDGAGSVGPVAAQFCRDLGAEWFLPNKDELKAIVNLATEIDSIDSTTGIGFADIGEDYIWSSTEFNRHQSLSVNIAGYAGLPVGYRSTPRFVIPVRRERV